MFEALHFLRRGDVERARRGRNRIRDAAAGVHLDGADGRACRGATTIRRRRQRPVRQGSRRVRLRRGRRACWCSRRWSTRRSAARGSWPSWCGGSITADAYHVSAPEPSGESAKRAIVKAIARRRAAADGDRLRLRARHGHAAERLDRDEGAQAGAGRARVSHSREFCQVDDRASARRGWRAERRGGGEGARNGLRAADDQPVHARPRVRPGLRAVEAAQSRTCATALVNGFGFGGQNSVAVFKKFED